MDDDGYERAGPRSRTDAADEDYERRGRHLLSAVERLIDDSYGLIAEVEAFRLETPLEETISPAVHQEVVAGRIISTFSTRSALTGGISAVPALLPGGGTAVAVVGGSLADMTLMLKYEVEMALCLTHLYGHDIRHEKGRWLAYALAAVHTYEIKQGDDYVKDMVNTQIEALMKYTPRQLSKIVVTVLGKLALLALSKNLVKALPLVGIVVSASANKLLTSSVGWRCVEALVRHRDSEGDQEKDVVDAKVT